MALHEKLDIDDSNTTAFSLSYDSGKHMLDESPSESEILNTTEPIAEHEKPSPRLDPSKSPEVIPPRKKEHKGRTLVLCFDGTGDQFDADNSNVVQLVSSLVKDCTTQLVYYQTGIGTYNSDGDPRGFTSMISKTLDEMLAWSIDAHVQAGYKFLMQHYTKGDRICLFGFSRGAYTARSLAGMLYKVGLLPPGNLQQVPFAYKMYKQKEESGWARSTEFRSSFSVEVTVEFMGLWDTVSSLGAIRGKSLPVTTASTHVRTFRHALALDERRARFQTHFWKEKQTLGRNHVKDNRFPPTTDVLEVWFAGCHCDVGGGSVSNITRHSLARISLRWMIRECFKTNAGILFNSKSLSKFGLDPTTLHSTNTQRPRARSPGPNDRIQGPLAAATTIPINIRALLKKKEKYPHLLKDSGCETVLGTEEEEELHDALSPKYDQLSIKKFWWILEIFPTFIRQNEEGKWVRYFRPHFGKPRLIPPLQKPNAPKVHRSVDIRMKAERARKNEKEYKPRANFDVKSVIWID